MRGVLVSIDAWNRKTASRQTVRVAAARNSATFGAGGVPWEPCLPRAPRLSLQLADDDLTGALQQGKGECSIKANSLKQVSDPWALDWIGSPVTVYSGDGPDLTKMRTEFFGRITSGATDPDTGVASLSFEVDKAIIDVPLLTATYGGGGGADGDTELRGNPKPAGFGSPINVQPVLINATYQIYQVDAYANCTGFSGVYEDLASFGASMGDYATYAALQAATITAGRWATCIAQGLFRLGAPPSGTITCDPTFGYGLPGSMMVRWMTAHAGVSTLRIRTTDFDALTAAVQSVVGALPTVSFWTSSDANVLDLMQRMAASCNASLLLMLDGTIGVTRVIGGADQITLMRKGGTPLVTAWQQQDPPLPWWQLKMAAARSYYVNASSEIDYVADVVDLGDYDAARTYRQGNVVTSAVDGARYIYQVDTPSAGTAPPDGNVKWGFYEAAPKWSKIADDGGKPADGATRNIIYRQSTAPASPAVGDLWVVAAATFDFTTGALPAGAGFSRASTATDVNAAGAVGSFGVHVPRIDARGILIERASTNLLSRSAEFDNAFWTPFSGGSAGAPTVTANTGLAPDGTTSADTLSIPAVAGAASRSALSEANYLSLPAGSYAFSVWMRGAAGGESLYLSETQDAVNYVRQAVTLTTTLQRQVLNLTIPTHSAYFLIGTDLRDAGQSAKPAMTVGLWGAQVEAGSATSYIPTTGGSATRAADVLTLSWGGKGVADGVATVTYTFDDGSTQDVATTISGGSAVVPTSLNRPRLRSAQVSGTGTMVTRTFDGTVWRDASNLVTQGADIGVANNATRNENGANSLSAPADPTTWTLGNGAVVAYPTTGRARLQLYTAGAYGFWGPAVACREGVPLFCHAFLQSDGGSSDTVNASVVWTYGDGSSGPENLSSVSARSLTDAAAGIVLDFSIVPPAGAVKARLYSERPAAGGYSMYVDDFYVSEVQRKADVTAASDISIDGVTTIPITADASGAPVQSTTTHVFKRLLGGVDVSASTTWSILSSASCTVSVSGGVVTRSGTLGTAGKFTLRTVQGGITRDLPVTFVRNDAPPPSSGGGGGGGGGSSGSSNYGNVNSSTGSTSYGTPGSESAFTLTAGSGGQISVSGTLDMALTASGSASATGVAKLQWRASGGTWADISGSETNGSGASYNPAGEPSNDTISLSATKTGLTNGAAYDVQALVKLASGGFGSSRVGTFSGTITGTGS